MSPLDLILTALAAFYAALALTSTHGPFGLFVRARHALPHGGALSCFVCAAVWCAALFYMLLLTPLAPLTWIVAAAGAGALAWRYTGSDHV